MTIHHTARHQVKAPEAGKVKAAIAADAEYIANEPGSRMPTAWQKTTPPKFADAPERRFRAWALGRRLVPRSARINRYGAVPRPGTDETPAELEQSDAGHRHASQVRGEVAMPSRRCAHRPSSGPACSRACRPVPAARPAWPTCSSTRRRRPAGTRRDPGDRCHDAGLDPAVQPGRRHRHRRRQSGCRAGARRLTCWPAASRRRGWWRQPA